MRLGHDPLRRAGGRAYPATCDADAQERIVPLHIQPEADYRDSAEGVINPPQNKPT
jgi:hypothetical protein